MEQPLEKAVFSLYSSIDSKLESGNRAGQITKVRPEVFQILSRLNSRELDYLVIKDLDNMDFFFALFMGMLRRAPSESDIKQWSVKAQNTPKDEFQKILIATVACSAEAISKGSWLTHYIPTDGQSGYFSMQNRMYQRTRIRRLIHRIYQIMPVSLRKVAKQIIRGIRR